ncbi:alpha-keto acid decarboxylase family protein [Paenibacillus sp. KQZ6P-2]|uniref:Alpha-keto-acid decarboxylase n=1 Tax=Paenibacillus mangrovi TaxID=2931978 RepID=A0A9X1WW24_9BACL|nr:alpha-keto acid decarboxylase family protein [Paenibacillus mangrovi]MCJ8013009.1 alpha-keto acid decarboxylase family protein [Paenibacillus mangrovi]
MKNVFTVGNYLLDRLSELGIRHIFGVPGDYNLSFLDDVIEYEGIDWVGNCNELNAAYAADGYARVNGIAALITTFGVGELSAINGIAGSYAENVPVVKITGLPTTKVINDGLYVHHTLGDGKFDHFSNMFKEVTVAQTLLTQENAAQEIDRVLLSCWREKRPVHINLPIDVYNKPINKPSKRLLDDIVSSNQDALHQLLTEITPIINQAKSPVILADYEVYRYQAQEMLQHFAEKTGFPVATLSMGKGVFNEEHPQFIGVYNGDLSSPYIQQRIDQADCIISIGVKLTDSITGGFSHGFSEETVIHIHPFSVKAKNKKYAPVTMNEALLSLSNEIEQRNFEDLNIISVNSQTTKDQYVVKEGMITQKCFFERISHFLKEKDVLLAEQGTSFFGATMMPLPKDTTFIGQPLWGSIGFTLPALLGTQLADQSRRNILLIGDGSFQLTAQEISTMLRQQIKPIIFLINNDGYTVERAIHGEDQVYNDIQMWDYQKIPDVLGPKERSLTFKVQTEPELEEALEAAERDRDHLIFIEVVMDRDDKPELLNHISKRFATQNI